jgi:energy-coupling factor transporter ATP-binding protein EcfA2
MNNIIEVKKLVYSSDNKKILDNISFDVKYGEFVTFICNEASGKSTLCKILSGLIITNSSIKIDNIILNESNSRMIRKNISFITENPDNIFLGENIKEDISFYLKNKGFKKNEIEEKIKKYSSGMGISKILNMSSNNISLGQKQIVAFFLAVSSNPKILIMDNALSMVDKEAKKKIFKLLKQYNKKGMTILNFTNDSNDSLIGNSVGVMLKNKLLIKDSLEVVFNDSKLFNTNGINLPFIVELSKKLSYYNLVESVYYDEKKLVDAIWK